MEIVFGMATGLVWTHGTPEPELGRGRELVRRQVGLDEVGHGGNEVRVVVQRLDPLVANAGLVGELAVLEVELVEGLDVVRDKGNGDDEELFFALFGVALDGLLCFGA